MKIFIIFLVITIYIVLHFTVPSISGYADCYDSSSHNADDLAFRARAQSWNQEKICQVEYDNISALQTCIADVSAKAPSRIRKYLASSYKSILQLIRPSDKGIEDQIAAHNAQCVIFPDYIFE